MAHFSSPLAAIAILIAVQGSAQDMADVPEAIAPRPAEESEEKFEWAPAVNQSMRFLMFQHGFRLGFQPGTRARLRGPFFRDWGESIRSTSGWGDGDPAFVNYVLHPMQGAVCGYIQVQNDPRGKKQEFGRAGLYWKSRLKALAWNTAYSVQFEVGPISEASLGNVGQRKGTSGYSDHVITPAAGFALQIAEDALDRYVVQKLESGAGGGMKAFYRTAFNPSRAFANVLRGRKP